jgi:hypothetical protein
VEEEDVTIGSGLTVMVPVPTPLQPLLVPVTVYEVVAAGEAVMVVVAAPVDQTYVVAPAAVNIPAWPLQIVAEVDVTLSAA